MRLSIIILFLCSSCVPLKGPTTLIDDAKLFIPITGITHMGMDGVGNIYLVQSNQLLLKYDQKGTKRITYDEQGYGMISSISCHNPLYIMVHYLESKTIVFLDRNFLVYQVIRYGKWTEDDITSAVIANDNNVWLYNNSKRKLQKYSLEGKIILESFDLYGLSNHSTYMSQIVEYNNRVYLKNTEGNICILDNLGRFIKDFPETLQSDLSVSISGLHATIDRYLTVHIFDEQRKEQYEQDPLPEFFTLFKGKLYGLYDNGVAILN